MSRSAIDRDNKKLPNSAVAAVGYDVTAYQQYAAAYMQQQAASQMTGAGYMYPMNYAAPMAMPLMYAAPSEPTEAEADRASNMQPIHGNSTNYNINPLLYNNIIGSDYYKALMVLQTYHEVIDEIDRSVDHVEPWAVGTSRVPSSCFCLLLKLFTMRLTKKQLLGMLQTQHSPLVRAVALLYLRYTCPPSDLWAWFEPYIEDMEEIRPSANKQLVSTVGEYTIKLLSEMSYYATTFPRIPVPIERKINVFLLLLKEKVDRRQSNFKLYEKGRFEKGTKITAVYSDAENEPAWYDAVVDGVDERNVNNLLVTFTEYGNSESVDLGDMKLVESDKKERGRSGSGERRRARSASRDKDDPKKDYMAEVLRNQREGSAAVGKNYAQRPASYKGSLSLRLDRYTVRKRSRSRSGERRRRSPERSRERDRDRMRSDGGEKSETSQVVKRQTVEQVEAMKRLRDKYGDASSGL